MRVRYIIFFILIQLTVALPASNQYRSMIYQAFISDDLSLWKKTIDQIQEKENISQQLRLELLNYQYGYIGWCLGNGLKEEATHYTDLAFKNLEFLENQMGADATLLGYRSALYGFLVMLNRLSAPYYGPKSVKYAHKAMETDQESPFAYIEYGHIQFYMPPVFGGSKEEAISYYRKAEMLMEQQPENLEQNWNYLTLLTLIARAYEAIGEYKQAKFYYEKILSIEPDYFWVKEKLYPELVSTHDLH